MRWIGTDSLALTSHILRGSEWKASSKARATTSAAAHGSRLLQSSVCSVEQGCLFRWRWTGRRSFSMKVNARLQVGVCRSTHGDSPISRWSDALVGEQVKLGKFGARSMSLVAFCTEC
jgi:hypothetical protein